MSKRVSKKNKKDWRKNADITDVESFLDDQRLNERLGISEKKDEELFIVDTTIANNHQRTKAERKAWASEPSTYLKKLIPVSAVQDPIKRNRVRSKEERKGNGSRGTIVKTKRLLEGMKQKKDFINNLKLQKKKRKEISYDKDLWCDDKDEIDTSWYNDETKKQLLVSVGKFKVRPPATLNKKRSELNAIDIPHPGVSYNPSFIDHKDLISEVVSKELEMIKKEEHIKRVTTVPKISPTDKEATQRSEMMEGLVKEEIKEEEGDLSNEKLSINPPVTRDNKKTKKQRRRQKELRMDALTRKSDKIEKKKKSDIYKLRLMESAISRKEIKERRARARRAERLEERKRVGTKRLARLKYEEPLQDFTDAKDLTGSLRNIPVRNSILKDRFFSLQKRNILAPNKLITKSRKKKVKKFIKISHRLEVDVNKQRKNVKQEHKKKLSVFTK